MLDKSVLVENLVKVSELNCENINKCIFWFVLFLYNEFLFW